MLNNTNMGVGDGRPKYLHIVQVKLEKVIILIAFFCKVALLCNITARWLKRYVAHFTTPTFKPLSCSNSGCCKCREYWLLIGQEYPGVILNIDWRHHGTSLATNQVCLWPIKHATYSDFVPNCRTSFATFCNNFSQSATVWFLPKRFDSCR